MKLIEVTLEKWVAHEHEHGGNRDKTWNGWSPGGAAVQLGVTRNAIHQAMRRGQLEAIRVINKGELYGIMIPDRSIEDYRTNHLNWASQRKVSA